MAKILIIEDENELQQIYKTRLEKDGYEVITAFSGNSGLGLAKSSLPDLILLDIMLPTDHFNGFDVLEQVKRDEALKHIPVIVLTNLDSERDVAFSIGAAAYLVKANTSIEEVVQTIKQQLKP